MLTTNFDDRQSLQILRRMTTSAESIQRHVAPRLGNVNDVLFIFGQGNRQIKRFTIIYPLVASLLGKRETKTQMCYLRKRINVTITT